MLLLVLLLLLILVPLLLLLFLLLLIVLIWLLLFLLPQVVRLLEESRDEYPEFVFHALNGMRLTSPEQVSS